ncbi:MAG: hypothetical protein ACKVI4_16005 [Actinomycetales bacterium]
MSYPLTGAATTGRLGRVNAVGHEFAKLQLQKAMAREATIVVGGEGTKALKKTGLVAKGVDRLKEGGAVGGDDPHPERRTRPELLEPRKPQKAATGMMVEVEVEEDEEKEARRLSEVYEMLNEMLVEKQRASLTVDDGDEEIVANTAILPRLGKDTDLWISDWNAEDPSHEYETPTKGVNPTSERYVAPLEFERAISAPQLAYLQRLIEAHAQPFFGIDETPRQRLITIYTAPGELSRMVRLEWNRYDPERLVEENKGLLLTNRQMASFEWDGYDPSKKEQNKKLHIYRKDVAYRSQALRCIPHDVIVASLAEKEAQSDRLDGFDAFWRGVAGVTQRDSMVVCNLIMNSCERPRERATVWLASVMPEWAWDSAEYGLPVWFYVKEHYDPGGRVKSIGYLQDLLFPKDCEQDDDFGVYQCQGFASTDWALLPRPASDDGTQRQLDRPLYGRETNLERSVRGVARRYWNRATMNSHNFIMQMIEAAPLKWRMRIVLYHMVVAPRVDARPEPLAEENSSDENWEQVMKNFDEQDLGSALSQATFLPSEVLCPEEAYVGSMKKRFSEDYKTELSETEDDFLEPPYDLGKQIASTYPHAAALVGLLTEEELKDPMTIPMDLLWFWEGTREFDTMDTETAYLSPYALDDRFETPPSLEGRPWSEREWKIVIDLANDESRGPGQLDTRDAEYVVENKEIYARAVQYMRERALYNAAGHHYHHKRTQSIRSVYSYLRRVYVAIVYLNEKKIDPLTHFPFFKGNVDKEVLKANGHDRLPQKAIDDANAKTVSALYGILVARMNHLRQQFEALQRLEEKNGRKFQFVVHGRLKQLSRTDRRTVESRLIRDDAAEQTWNSKEYLESLLEDLNPERLKDDPRDYRECLVQTTDDFLVLIDTIMAYAGDVAYGPDYYYATVEASRSFQGGRDTQREQDEAGPSRQKREAPKDEREDEREDERDEDREDRGVKQQRLLKPGGSVEWKIRSIVRRR